MEAVKFQKLKVKVVQESKTLDYLSIVSCFLLVCLEWSWAGGDKGPAHMILSFITVAVSLVFIISPEYLLPQIFLASLLQGSCVIVFITASRYLTLVFLFAQFLHIILQKRIERRGLLYAVVLCVYFLCSSIFSRAGLQAEVLSILMNILFMYFTAHLPSEKQNRIFRLLLCAGILLSLYFFISLLTGHGVSLVKGRCLLLWDSNVNIGGRAAAQMGLLFLGYCLYIRNNSKRQLLVSFVLYMYFLHLTTLTGSRSALLGVLGGLGILILLQIYLAHGTSCRIRELGVGAVVVCLSLAVVFITPTILKSTVFTPANPSVSTPTTPAPDTSTPSTPAPDTSAPSTPVPDTSTSTNPNLTPYNRMMARFNIRAIIRSGGTGRIATWEILIRQAILPHPLFGIGFPRENTMLLLSENGKTAQKAHNIVIAIISSLGFVGFALLFIPFAKTIFSALRKIRTIPLLIIPLALIFGALCNGIGENIYTERFFWFSISICLWLLWNPAQDEKSSDPPDTPPETEADS